MKEGGKGGVDGCRRGATLQPPPLTWSVALSKHECTVTVYSCLKTISWKRGAGLTPSGS
jgi:hypothetical protein